MAASERPSEPFATLVAILGSEICFVIIIVSERLPVCHDPAVFLLFQTL
jgi:hypothetical protein